MMEKMLDELVNGVIDGPDDLMGIGECLNLLDKLESSRDAGAVWSGEIGELRRLFNGIILESSSNPEADLERVRGLISCLGSGEKKGTEAALSSARPDSGLSDWNAVQSLVEDDALRHGTCSDPIRADDMAEGAGEIQDPELMKDFIEEASEHLSSIELNMLALETDPTDQEAINAVFRPFHSIKGVAGFLNLKDIHHLSHEVENLLDAARSGDLVVTNAVIDIVLNAVDILKVLLGELEKTPSLKPSPLVQPFLDRVKNFSAGEPTEPGAPVRKVGQILVEHGVVDEPALEGIAERIKETGKKIGEELIEEGMVSPREVSRALREQRHARDYAASVRVDTRKLDNLVDMVGELVIAQSMVLQHAEVQLIKDQKLQKDSVQLKRITAELQRISTSMRMVPIKNTFQKMIRLVRDLSVKSGKMVSLVMKGEETEIDRNMVEEIYEPLVHMIRNSVDHGIETPEERKQSGKESSGTIVISAEQKGGNIVIDIQDDGKGLNAQRIREKAIERGIIAPEDDLSEQEIYALIMAPGFSTRDQVTEVSGRGVGMDVVKRSVEKLRGKLEISSVSGRGTHLQLKLPLTMAIIDGMIIKVGHERYVVPTIALRESLRPTQESYMTVQGKAEMIKVRDSLMPLVRLHKLFNVEPHHRNPWEGLLLIINEGSYSYGLFADEILGRQEVVIKSLGGSLPHLSGISGGAILGDGRVALILDVKGVVSLYEESVK